MFPLFLLSLTAVALWNWQRWRADRALALRLRADWQHVPLLPGTPAPLHPGSPAPLLRVSVLVAAWNEAEMIRQHIASFRGLRYPHKELVLCAGGVDGTDRIAREHEGEGVTVLEQEPGEGKQRALRRCLAEAKGEIVFLTDADGVLDDDSFERTLAPLIVGGEAVSSGTVQPLRQQLGLPFVIHQWCTQLYTLACAPDHAPGLQGANCALRRDALERAGGFALDVRTGTDYHLAKRLLQLGYRIRLVRDSLAQTRYPDTYSSYWRRQSRWVRNLMLHGPGFGDVPLIRAAQRTAAIGLAMLSVPPAAVLAAGLGVRSLATWMLGIWSVLFWYTFLARMRYVSFARLHPDIAVPVRTYALIPLHMVVDFVAWAVPLVDRVLRPQQW